MVIQNVGAMCKNVLITSSQHGSKQWYRPEIFTAAGLHTEGEEVKSGLSANELVGAWVPAVTFIRNGVFEPEFPHSWS